MINSSYARRVQLGVWIALTNILFINFLYYYMELLMDSI